jgi:hypothetical protein
MRVPPRREDRMKSFARRPSPAMVVACAALVVALTGTAIAAVEIGKNDVGARELGPVKLRTATDLVTSDFEDNHGDATARCKASEQLLGGGALFRGADSDEFADIDFDGPKGKRAWTAGGYVNGDEAPDDFTLVVTAVCLKR